MASIGSIASLGLGALATGLGGLFGSSAASDKRKQMKQAAGQIGVDTTATSKSALGTMGTMLPSASQIGAQINDYYSQALARSLEQAYPGYAGGMQKYMGNVGSYMAGELPSDVESQVFRSAAGRSLMGGYGGSGLARNLTARDLGLTSLGLQQYGMGLFSQVPSAFPRAQTYDVANLLFTPGQEISLRAQENAQRANILAGAAAMPTSGETWGNTLSQMGGVGMGFGLQSLLGGGGGRTGGGILDLGVMSGQTNPYGVSYGSPNIGASLPGLPTFGLGYNR